MKRAPRRGVAAKRGQVAGSKGGSTKQKKPSIASNSVPSIATIRMLYLWSWGPIVGPVNGLRSVKLDGTPVVAEDGTVNYPAVKWQFRSGELNQERMTGISESSNEIAVGQQLLSTTAYVYTVTNSMLDAVRVRFSWPQLQSQDSSGNIDGVRIAYAVDVSTDNGPFQQVLASEVNRKNVTKYERSHRIELPAGSRWAIRARRITPEFNSSLVQDGMYIEAIAEVVDSDQEYPLTAVSCVEYDAEQFGGDIAKIAVLMRGRIVRVPMNYDPESRTYATGGSGTTNGVWDGTFKEAYTNNPAWVFYDLALHPYYGLGDRIDASMINRWSLYRIGQYCDQMVPDGKGGEEPRFTCNLYLQKQAEAWAVLQDLAAIFHGLAFWDGSQITVNADMPQDPVYNYTLSQILDDGAVKYTGSKLRERHSQAMVSFDDPGRGYDTDKEPVFDESAIAEYGVREISVEAVGCTSRGQAQRAGQWALMTEQLQLRGASFRVGLDGYIPKPGKVITLSDPMLAGRANGGRIAAVAGRVVTVDRDIAVPTGARLLVNLPSGKSEARQVRSVSGRQITVMADFSEVPQAECGWVLDFDDLKLMQFYVRNVTRPEWHQFQLECIQYEPSKFDAIDYGTVIDDRPISVLPPGVQDAPARVLISSHSAVDQGIAVTTMTISWDAAPGAVAYDVEWRWGSRDWVKVPRTGELAADIRGVYAGQYLARVRAVSAMDVSSIPTTSVLTDVAGKTTPPPAVTHLVATPLVYAIGLAWGFPAGAEDTQRTEIWYGKTNNRQDATKLADFAYPQKDHVLQLGAAGLQFFFWARLVDRSGNIGPWYPAGVGVPGASSSNQSEYEEYFKDKIGNGALYPALRQDIALISGPPTMPGSVNNRLQAINDQLQEQIDSIADLADSMPYKPDQTYATDQGVLGDDGKLYQAKKAVPVNTPPPNTTYWTDVGQAVRTADGLAARVSTVETKVTEQDGKLTAQALRIDGVQSSLAGKADASTVASLGNTVTQQGAAITAQGTAITSVQATVGQQLDNLLRRGSFEDGIADPWTGAVAVETVTVPGTSAGKAIAFVANSFCGVGNSVLTSAGQQFDLSADVCRQFMTAGQTANLQMQFYDKSSVSLGYFNAFIVQAGGSGFQNFTGRITAPAGAVAARFVTRIQPADGAGRALWCNMTATRVTQADIGNAIATSALDGRVAQTEAGLSVQGTAVTQLQSTINGIGGSGSNQMPAEYSVFNSVTAPAMTIGGAIAPSTLADSATQGGYALKLTSADASTTSAVYMHTSNSPGVLGSFPMSYLNGKYIVSFYAKANVTGRQVRFWLRALNSAASAQNSAMAAVTLTDVWARYSAVIDLSNAATFSGNRMVFAVQPNLSGVSGTEISFDRIMIEKQIGTSTAPSVYVTGNSAESIRAQATAINQMNTSLTQQGTAITAQAERLDGIYVQVNPEMEGDSSGMAGQQGSLVGVWTEQSARTDEFIATGKRVDTVQAQFGEVSASVQTISETVAGVDGKVSAISSWKTETNANGRRVATGIVQGSNGEVGEILLSAQRLAIVDGVDGNMILPFVVQNGQVFINQAVINTAFIQEIVAGMTIRSETLNAQGLPLLEINFKAGTFILRGQSADGSTLITNGQVNTYYASGNPATKMGIGI
ncbi:TipJ family phage tail tip protein [Pseudomonas sp. 1121_17]|uniref:TipJ family phage tail tip protein n=1 Tax=Pseudomonas sp. 1121_17 TaxID=2604458 RepID=UPI0040643606